MKISEAIAKMQTILSDCGDMELVAVQDVDGRFCCQYDIEIEPIEFPVDIGKFEGPYCGLLMDMGSNAVEPKKG